MRPKCGRCGAPSIVNRHRFYLCARHQLAWMRDDLAALPTLTDLQARVLQELDAYLTKAAA